MDNTSIDRALELINEIEKLDFDKSIVEGNQGVSLEDICFKEYNAIEFKSLLYDVLSRLKRLLESDIKYMLPNNIHFNGGNYDLINQLSNLVSSIFSNRENAKYTLERLIGYVSLYESWNKNIAPIDINLETSQKLERELTLIQEKTKNEQKTLDDLIAKQKESESKLSEILKDIERKLGGIAESAEKAVKTTGEIDSKLATSEANNKQIETVKQQINDLRTKISENIEEYQKEFLEIKTQNEDSLSNLTEAKKIKDEILSKKEDVEVLLNGANDGSLGARFSQRESRLMEYSKVFGFLVVSALVGTIFWTLVVFKNYEYKDWVGFAINVIRTFPAWFLVWWLIGRFTSERKLQEEYAFKAAIAMSMRNHSELLSGDDKGSQEERASKQIMLQKAMSNIYQNPNQKDRGRKQDISSKEIKDTIKELGEIVKNFKG